METLKKEIPTVIERRFERPNFPVLLDPEYLYPTGKDKRRERRKKERKEKLNKKPHPSAD